MCLYFCSESRTVVVVSVGSDEVRQEELVAEEERFGQRLGEAVVRAGRDHTQLLRGQFALFVSFQSCLVVADRCIS